ncbi:MAG: ATP phosphoribosyltransferase regulatory subunit [Rickettsiales bacterium]|nr:ATP phosphoribosyltransferase regulatory subunit [Rickettsiales bacterium]
MTQALLPSGLQDLLPPDAAREQHLITELLNAFSANGYQQVTPPMVEFEETLLDGKGLAYAPQTFRVPDPLSQKMMGLRADITTQVARIASNQLSAHPKPLRLSYAGRVLRSVPQGLFPERQLVQSGFEVIGVDTNAAMAEVILVSAQALSAVGCDALVVDLTLAGLLDILLSTIHFSSEDARQQVISAVKRKDVAALADDLPVKDTLKALLSLPTHAPETLRAVEHIALPAVVKEWFSGLSQVYEIVMRDAPQLRLTIDPLESHGFEYHEGLCFSLFDKAKGREVGRGGRYVIHESPELLVACGATLYVRAILECGYLPNIQRPSVMLAPETTSAQADALRMQGYVTLRAITQRDWRDEAQALGCSHLWHDETLIEL